jgi:predicted nucleotidyltransferase
MDEEKSKLEQLKDALFLKSYLTDLDDKAHHVLGMVSHETEHENKCSRYANDMVRFLEQMKMSIFMLKNLGLISTTATEAGWDETHLVPYYQGIFISQLYGLKEKVTQLLKLLTDEEPANGKHEEKISMKKLRERHIVKELDIDEHLAKWDLDDQNFRTGIKIALSKRVHHQHYLDPFQLNRELVDLRSARAMLSTESRPYLSELGIKKMQDMEKESSTKLVDDALAKAENTLEEVMENLDKISETIMKHFSLSSDPEVVQEVQKKITELGESTKILNEANESRIHQSLKPTLDKYAEEIRTEYGEHVEAMYIYGSVPRGEFNPLFSDINLLVILKDDSELAQHRPAPERRFLDLVTVTVSEFDSDTPEARKRRFICYADGKLIFGPNLIEGENFPKPGLELAYLLNFDVLDDISEFERWIAEHPNPSEGELDLFAKRVAKRYVDFMFGVAMTNEPYYTSSRIKRLEWIHKAFDDDGYFANSMLAILRSEAILDINEMPGVLDAFKENAEKNLEEMSKVVEMLKKR